MIQGTIYRIMIGCPSDITEEIQIAKRVILKWSCTNAEAHKIVLLPLHWSDNSYPGCGQHPQKMLDRQLVDKSDMLVCIFGSKIGTATDTSDSGSIEEIEEHIKAGKHVMIFFKRQGDILNSDPEQLKKVQEFRSRIQTQAMWCEFQDAGEFNQLFSEKLTLFLNDNWLVSQKQTITRSEEINVTERYSEDELCIFSRWANNPTDDWFMAHYTRYGLEVRFGYHNGYTFQRGKEQAEYEDFMDRLCGDGLVKFEKYDQHNIKVYSITKKGYDFAQTLPRYDENNNVIEKE